MNDLPLTVSAVRNDGESFQLSLRGDDGQTVTATIPCTHANDILQAFIQGFLAASVRATNMPHEASTDFSSPPQTFRATGVQLVGDLDTDDTMITFPTMEGTELLITLQPHLLEQLIHVAAQRKGVRSLSDSTN